MIDSRALLDQLLGGARDLATKGADAAARGMGVGDDAASRGSFQKGALGGAAAGAALALLLGTKTGRKVGQAGALAGGLALLGKLAHDAWSRHQAAAGAPAPQPEPAALPAPQADARARALLSAVVAAAKSDGHVDAAEMAMIREKLAPLGAEAQDFLISELARPLDPHVLAMQAPDDQTRREIYAVTAALCDPNDPPERDWMTRLAPALGLSPVLAAEIERGVAGHG